MKASTLSIAAGLVLGIALCCHVTTGAPTENTELLQKILDRLDRILADTERMQEKRYDRDYDRPFATRENNENKAVAEKQQELDKRYGRDRDRPFIVDPGKAQKLDKRYDRDRDRPVLVKDTSKGTDVDKRYQRDRDRPFLNTQAGQSSVLSPAKRGRESEITGNKAADGTLMEKLAKYLLSKQKRDYDIPFPSRK